MTTTEPTNDMRPDQRLYSLQSLAEAVEEAEATLAQALMEQREACEQARYLNSGASHNRAERARQAVVVARRHARRLRHEQRREQLEGTGAFAWARIAFLVFASVASCTTATRNYSRIDVRAEFLSCL